MYSKEPISVGGYFQVKIDQLDERWSGSLMLGVTTIVPDRTVTTPPTCALLLKRASWIVTGQCVHHGGRKVRSDLSFDLDELRTGQSAGVFISQTGHLHILIDGQDCGSVVWVGTSDPLYAVVDLYGQVSQVSTLSERWAPASDATSASQTVHTEEKALRESSSTEKNRFEPKTSASRTCSYKQACGRFVRFMGVPDGFFESESIFCGCERCYRAQNEAPDKYEENLRGWCRWPIKSRSKPDKKDAPASNEKWQHAYHGSKLNVVRRILDQGHLLPNDLKTWQRTPVARRSAKDHDGESGGQLLFSPVLQPSVAPVSEYFDPVFKVT